MKKNIRLELNKRRCSISSRCRLSTNSNSRCRNNRWSFKRNNSKFNNSSNSIKHSKETRTKQLNSREQVSQRKDNRTFNNKIPCCSKNKNKPEQAKLWAEKDRISMALELVNNSKKNKKQRNLLRSSNLEVVWFRKKQPTSQV